MRAALSAPAEKTFEPSCMAFVSAPDIVSERLQWVLE